MKNINFPIFKTKSKDNSRSFDLTDFNERQAYFEYKAGPEIKKLRSCLEENTFIAFLMGKKSSGKGTYSKMFKEVVSPDKIEHFSIGDMVRSFDEITKDKEKEKEFVSFLEKDYRGFIPLQDIIKSLKNRSTKTLLPTELILALVKREIGKLGKKAIFIDGFPRDLDQISYSLFFRDLINYRQDPDIFILIDVPTAVIDERIKSRVICPLCQTSRNLKLLPTKKVEYSKKDKKFHLICDNPNCPSALLRTGKGAIMVTKEGDELGTKPIKERLDKDEILIERALSLQGVSKILLRNSVPIDKTKEFVDDYEITPGYSYAWNEKEKKIEVMKKPWEFLDDQGVRSNSLMPPPVVVSLIKQLAKIFNV
ncbi:nucleoside monophosphate kinase [Patescibacteria group bacterium]|nr:nucleoside monophosphate kinase [Patescibacteria group bacterium]